MKHCLIVLASLAIIFSACSNSETKNEAENNECKLKTNILEPKALNETDSDTSFIVSDVIDSIEYVPSKQSLLKHSVTQKVDNTVETVTRIGNNLIDDTVKKKENGICNSNSIHENSSKQMITIYTYPPRAKVYLDNNYVGISPCPVLRDNNDHFLVINKNAKYYTVYDTVNLKSNKYLIYNLVKVDPKSRNTYNPELDD